MRSSFARILPAAWVVFLALAARLPGADSIPAPDYASVEAIIARHCLDCHAAQDPEGQLVLETFETLMKGGENGAVILPGRSADSRLVQMVEGSLQKEGKKLIMPPGKRQKLKPDEIAAIKAWIDLGAPAPKEPPKIVRELVLPKILPTVPPRRSIQAIAFAAGPKLLAVGRYGEVELISSESRAVVRVLKGHRGSVNALALSADGKQLGAAAGEPALFGEARLWNLADGSLIRTFEGHKDALYSIAISPDGKILATGSYDQKIKLWELETGKELQTLSAHNGAIFDLAFRPDGKILASASGDRTVKLWNVATGKRLETLSQPLKEQYALAWSPDGRRLAAAGVDHRIRVWQVSDSAAETTNPLLLTKFAHEGAVLNLLYSPDGKTLLSSAEDRSIKLWESAQVTEKLVFEPQPDVTPALAFLDRGRSFAVGRLDGTVEYYDGENGRHLPPAAPELRAIEPRGLQRGTSATFELRGQHLGGVTQVVASSPKLTAALLPDLREDQVRVRFSAAADLARGAYAISLVASGGESGKLNLFVDDLPQAVGANAGSATALPVSFWGTLDSPGKRVEFQFEASAGQTIVLDLAVKSVGSKITNGFLALVDARGAVLESDGGFDGADRFLARKIPADGHYVARVTDQMLGASQEHFYRLSVGALPYVTGVFPLSVAAHGQTDLQLMGFNLPVGAHVSFKSDGPGEVDVPIDIEKFRTRRAFKVLVADGPQQVEIEPNDTPAQATPMVVPGAVNGRIWKAGPASSRSSEDETGAGHAHGPAPGRVDAAESSLMSGEDVPPAADVDLFRFEARSGQSWMIESDAARRGSPVDTRLEILHPDGKPVQRLLLQAVRNTAINFRGVDSNGTGVRLDNYEEMELNEYLYLNGDVMRLFRMPQGPDSDMLMYASAGKRRAYFDTSAVAHALDEPGFIVEPHASGAKLTANGLPVFALPYANDDDGERKLGSDSRLQFTAPTNGDYLVRVTDTRGHGGDRFAYRLIVRQAQPDFTVTLHGANPVVSPGSGQSFTVQAEPLDGFDEDIRVDITGLPPGFSVSTPVVIQSGHTEATGALHAALDAPPPNDTNGTMSKVTATALVAGKPVTKEVNNLGRIRLGDQAKIYVALEPYSETATNQYDPKSAAAQPRELTLAPGQTMPAWLKIKRNGHDDLVTFFAENLPHGVIVADIGLNGVLIPKGESERRIFFSAAKWVPEQDRLFFMVEQQAGKQASRPVLLKVRKPTMAHAGEK